MKGSIFFILILLLVASAFSQTGPGGVGSSTSNVLWLRGDDILQGEATSVTSWPDQSGNNHHASQGNSSYQPILKINVVNGHKVVRFDGTNDYFDNSYTYSGRTIFAVYQELSTNQQASDLGQLWGSYGEAAHLALDARNTPGTWSFDGNGSTTGRLGLNGAAYGAFSGNPSTPNWAYNRFDLVSAEFNATKVVNRQVIGSLVPTFSVGEHQYGGDIAELIVFNRVINNGERIIVENYLAAKYNLTITNDFFVYQTTHPHEVAGIGRSSAGNESTAGMSSGLLRFQNASSLNDGDYLLFGHQNGGKTSWSTIESPDGGINIQRLPRVWILDETGDVGTIDVVVDISTLPVQPVGHTMYALLVDADGDFSSGASVYEIPFSSGTEYILTGLDVSDGQYMTIASMRGIVDHTVSSSDGAEPSNASINVQLNFIPRNNVTVDYNTANGSAAAGSDYTASASTLTIVAPATSNNYTITVSNDLTIENTETFSVTLSNPSHGALGNNPTHTYSILDDDNPRKIYFDLATSNNLESVTSGNIAVSINMVDGSNPTSVDYTVTSGNAIGGGVDYTLSAGTLTIPSGSLTNNISFTINNDALYELNETFTLTLSNPINSNLDVVSPASGTGLRTHTYTITNDDTAPVIQFNATSGSGTEATTPVLIPVELSTISGATTTVNYTITGTATGGGIDYFLANGVLTIGEGVTSRDLTLAISEDLVEEIDETIIITLSGPTHATLGANTVYTYTIKDNDNLGNAGPGGVGDLLNMKLWLRADDVNQANLTLVPSWEDQSGNNNDADQATVASQPTYRTNIINGHDVVRFDGTNDYYSNAHSYSGRTVFVVYQMLSAIQSTSDLAQVWGSYNEGVQVALDARSGGGLWSFDGNSSNTAKFGIDGASYGAFGANPTSPKWTYNVAQMVAVEFDANRPVTSQDIGALIAVAGHNLGGDIAELVVFNISIDNAKKLIIENYLSAKYNITITTDIYPHDAPGNYENEVAGIGRLNVSNFHTDAQGSGIVRVLNPNNLGDNEFFLWGHNNGETEATEYSDIPLDTEARMKRVWRVSEVNSSGTAIDVGSVDIHFDLTGLGSVTPSDLRLLVDTDNDGVFSDETSISGATLIGGNVYGFIGVSALGNNMRFTLGTANISQTTLPIVLISFTAKVIDDGSVKLEWETATEINNEYFTIEKSRDGGQWIELNNLPGAGNSTQHINYQLVDQHPYAGVSYYRLKQTDFDGQFTYSNIEMVSTNKLENSSVSIYPNPTKDRITVTGSLDELSIFSIHNLSGQEVTNLITVLAFDGTKRTIDLTQLSPGIYFINTKTKSFKIYKK